MSLFNANLSTAPFCPPDWRSRRAYHFAETGRPVSRMHDDRGAWRLVAFLRERRLAARSADEARRDPALAYAAYGQ